MKLKKRDCVSFAAFLLVLALNSCGARGAVVPAQNDAGHIPNLTVWDETNRQNSLPEMLREAGNGPVILLPVYTRCTMSCPVLAAKLKAETARMMYGQSYRVLLFSFDPSEDAASLRGFREREKLPGKWMLVRAEETDIRRFSDFFHYSIMADGAMFVHPNQIFLLDHTLRWRATIIGVDWDATELGNWMQRVEAPGILGWVAMNPEKLVWIGFGGLLLSLVGAMGWLLWRKPPAVEGAGTEKA